MKISIIGCGFAGLTSALFLARDPQNQITIHEKFDSVKAVGAGFLIQPSSMEVLKILGVYEELLQYGEKVTSIVGINHNKKQVFATQYKDYSDSDFGVGIHRTILFDILYKKSLNYSNITIKLNEEVSDLTFLQQQCDLLILAAGTHCALRTQLPITQKYRPYPYGCIWTTQENNTTESHKLQQFVRYSQEMFGILPSGYINNKRVVSVFWSLPVVKKMSYDKNTIIEQMKLHYNHPCIEDLRTRDFSFAYYADVYMKQYNYQNIVVIGDAAHGMSPQMGQGVNMAFLDAYYLFKVLEKNQSIIHALNEYTMIRKKHLRFYNQASRFLTPLFQSDNKMWGYIRDILFYHSQKFAYSRKMSGHILSGKRLGWLKNSEIKY